MAFMSSMWYFCGKRLEVTAIDFYFAELDGIVYIKITYLFDLMTHFSKNGEYI